MLFSKLICCVNQVTFFCMKCPVGEHYSKKIYLKRLCSSQRLLVTHRKNITYWRNKVKSPDIRGLWKKKTYSEKIYSVDTLTDTATVNFGSASSLSQSKKDNVIEVVNLINIFSLCYMVQFCYTGSWKNCFS